MPVLFPQNDAELLSVVKSLLKQHHVDIQRLWGQVPPPSAQVATNPPGAGGLGGGGGLSSAEIRMGVVANVTPAYIAAGTASGTVDTVTDPLTWAGTGTTYTAYNLWKWPLPNGTRVLTRELTDGGQHGIFWGDRLGRFLGKTDAQITKGSSGNVTLYKDSSTSLGLSVSALNRFATVATTKWVWVEHDGVGWFLTAAEC